jgi:hypothetical protein
MNPLDAQPLLERAVDAAEAPRPRPAPKTTPRPARTPHMVDGDPRAITRQRRPHAGALPAQGALPLLASPRGPLLLGPAPTSDPDGGPS